MTESEQRDSRLLASPFPADRLNEFFTALEESSRINRHLPRLAVYPHSFYSQYCIGGYQAIQEGAYPRLSYASELTLFPINRDNRWMLVTADIPTQKLVLYDPFGNQDVQPLINIKTFMQKAYKCIPNPKFEAPEWVDDVKDFRRTGPKTMSGIMICSIADNVAHRRPYNTQIDTSPFLFVTSMINRLRGWDVVKRVVKTRNPTSQQQILKELRHIPSPVEWCEQPRPSSPKRRRQEAEVFSVPLEYTTITTTDKGSSVSCDATRMFTSVHTVARTHKPTPTEITYHDKVAPATPNNQQTISPVQPGDLGQPSSSGI